MLIKINFSFAGVTGWGLNILNTVYEKCTDVKNN